MPLRANYHLEERREVAEKSLASVLLHSAVGLRLLPLQWEELKQSQSGHWERLASARAPLLHYICAAYALEEKARFDYASLVFLQNSYSQVKGYTAPLGQLWFDIAIAASVGNWAICQDAAIAILQQHLPDDADDFPMVSAVVLARFATGDLDGARRLANRLLAGVEAKRCAESGWAFMIVPWAYAAVHFANGAYEVAYRAVCELDRAHANYISGELCRYCENNPAISSFDFWDWNGTALQAIAHKWAPQKKRTAAPLSDWQWTLRKG